jgi:D-3-phosphoglycerate dehydrogenase
MVKVLIADKMSPRAAAIFKERGIEVDEITGLEKEELRKIIANYDGLAIRSSTKVSDKLLSFAPNLKVIGRAGIGVDNVDVHAASAKGVVVMNTPFGNSITTAEHAIAMLMAAARQIPLADRSTRKGLWEKSRFMGVEISGKTLGIIGCGNIGAVVADRAQGLKMRVIAFDPFLSSERAEDLGIAKVELNELFARSDFISLHTPLTDSTRGIIGAEAFAQMRDGVRIVNCARGGLIDEEALKTALESGKVAAAALDVFAEEPARENPLFEIEGVIATPHLGASTTEAQVNVAVQVAEQMSDYLLSGAVSNALNMPSVTAEEAPKLKPYMELAKHVGSFAGQLLDSDIKTVTIEYEGLVAAINTKPLTAVVLEGLMQPSMDSVNMVNAPIIAKERNIDIAEVLHDREGDYHTLIRVTIKTSAGELSIAGTLFSNRSPRIVSIMGVEIEALLSEYMLYVANNDKPGLIGNLGSILGDAGINIGTFNLGRDKNQEQAIALISVDQKPTDEVIAAVMNLPNVRQVKSLKF